MWSLALITLLASLTTGAPVAAPVAASPERYVVVLKPGQPIETAPTILSASNGGLSIASAPAAEKKIALNDFNAFTAVLTDEQVAAVKADARVAYVELDGVMHTMDIDDGSMNATAAVDEGGMSALALTTQTGAPWGLGRISRRTRGSTTYTYDTTAGAGTCVYVIDTGIVPSLAEFEGRATALRSFIAGSNTDDNGHGTHVAGTVGARTYGVAKKARIYAIKVLDASGSGSNSGVISGIQYAVTDSRTRGSTCPKGFIINMSLGGGRSQAVNDAVAAANDAGILVVVAAGNEAQNLANVSPASEPKTLSVGATDVNDNYATFSNYGSGMGILAPGVNIVSLTPSGGTRSLSGTSMASPHVAGLAAYLAGLSGSRLSVAQLKSQIQSLATTGAILLSRSASSSGTPNRLAFNGATA